MRLRTRGVLAGLAVFLMGIPSAAHAAAVPVRVDMDSLRAIQKFSMNEANDKVYLLIDGVAGGHDFHVRLPEGKTLEANPKKPAVLEKDPITLWKGELNDGEFALLTVTVMHGAGADAGRLKDFFGKEQAAEKKVAGLGGKTLAGAADVKKLAADVLKAQRDVLINVKQTFAREKKTDHFGGQFDVIIWNNNGKLVTRLDPTGLIFGEHNGKEEKIYTKLKNTLANVLVQAASGEWGPQQLLPVSDDGGTVRVKMLETEFIKVKDADPIRHVTDYLADVQVFTSKGGKDTPIKWRLGPDQNVGKDDIHLYWNFAESNPKQ